jgi:DNA polymerase III delta prime subunit
MLLGNVKNREILSQNVKSGHLHHCLIFEGPIGIGRKQTAYWLAKVLNCDNVSQSSFSGHQLIQPCEECWQCRMITNREHPDIIEINHDPQLKSKMISIRQANELIENMHYHISQAKNRVVIFEPFEDINTKAANALLKTFEEPPKNTFFVLVCQSAHQLLITIRSRAQRFRFVPLTSKVEKNIVRQNIKSCIEQELDDDSHSKKSKSTKKTTKKTAKKTAKNNKSTFQLDFNDADTIEYCIEKILRMSEGCPQKAYALTENRLEEFLLLEQLKSDLLKSMRGSQIQKHQFVKDNSQHLISLLDIFDLLTRDLLYFYALTRQLIENGEVPTNKSVVDIFKSRGFDEELYQFENLDSISRWSTKVSYGKIWRFYNKIQDVRKKRLINVNARLLLDGLLMEFEAMLFRTSY